MACAQQDSLSEMNLLDGEARIYPFLHKTQAWIQTIFEIPLPFELNVQVGSASSITESLDGNSPGLICYLMGRIVHLGPNGLTWSWLCGLGPSNRAQTADATSPNPWNKWNPPFWSTWINLMKQMGQFNNPYQITYTDAAYLITRPTWLIRSDHQHNGISLDY